MPSFRIEFLPAAVKDLRRIQKRDSRAVARIKQAIEGLAADPYPSTAKPLRGYEKTYRVREGDYRVVYRVEGKRLVILVLAVGDRGDVYERLRRRLTR